VFGGSAPSRSRSRGRPFVISRLRRRERMDWFDGNGQGSIVDVQAMLDGKSWDALMVIVQSGALLSISTTRDGGALGITLTVDGRYRREYFRDPEQLELWASEAVEPVVEAARSSRASAVQRTRRKAL
jgi:hypothetical protein